LTDTKIRQAKPGPRPYRLFDGGGLWLEVRPSGGKLWRLKYRHGGREQRLALGAWPAVPLAEARRQRDAARALVAQGRDPAEERRQAQARERDTFQSVAEEWRKRYLSTKAPGHQAKTWQRLTRWVLPVLGPKPVASITAADILSILQCAASVGRLETAHRVRQAVGQLCRYAVATGRLAHDPTPALRGALPSVSPRHFPAPTDPAEVGRLLRMLDAYDGSPEVRAALRLLPLLFVRPGELRRMRWEEIDFAAAEWRFTASKTKAPHLVPLSRQVVAILREIEPLTRHLPGGWVFPSPRDPSRPLSDMALTGAYRRLGIDTHAEVVPHGWRAVARTLLHERLGYPPEVIEHQLAHAVPDALGTAYNRTQFLATRREMLQRWADYLDRLKAGEPAEVVPLRRGGGVIGQAERWN
jgi:integrase